MHKLFAGYRQFYVVDLGKSPPAPEDWTDEDIAIRAKVADGIVALCPQNDITAHVQFHMGLGPNEDDMAQFIVLCPLTIIDGPVALVGWPDIVAESHNVEPADYTVEFRGYELDTENEFYQVWVYPGRVTDIKKKKDIA